MPLSFARKVSWLNHAAKLIDNFNGRLEAEQMSFVIHVFYGFTRRSDKHNWQHHLRNGPGSMIGKPDRPEGVRCFS